MAPNYQDHQHHIQSFIDTAVNAADPAKAVGRYLRCDGETVRVASLVRQADTGNIYLISVGKAAVAMGKAAAEILGPQLTRGIVITKFNQLPSEKGGKAARLPERMELFGAGHPISDESSLKATTAVIDLLKCSNAQDLVICLISGGTSSLLSLPLLQLDYWQLLVNKLLASGCTIKETNSVRNKLDRIKGGGLAKAAAPAQCVSLILSDVIGNPLDIIGSGPTAFNTDSPDRALQILNRYKIRELLPENAWEAISNALLDFDLGDREPALEGENIIVGDVRQAATAAVEKAKKLGFEADLLTTSLEGEAREVGKFAAALAKDAPENSVIVLGAETTVTLKGSGNGGRNQELALAAAIALDGWPDRIVAGFATDGEDGPTAAAGALVSGETVSQAHFIDIDAVIYLDNNDSYSFFEKVGGHICTGPTGTNVNDLIFVIHYGS